MQANLKSELTEYCNELHGWVDDPAQFTAVRELAKKHRKEAMEMLKAVIANPQLELPSKADVSARKLN